MPLVWVIGKGGLLGNALYHELTKSLAIHFQTDLKIDWQDVKCACTQFKSAVNEFALQAKGGAWQIYWAAGIGTMHSTIEDLQTETDILKMFIASLLHHPDLNLQDGSFIFASSAGAIYAGKYEDPINEGTPPTPINAYGHAKLEQESITNRLNKHGEGATVISCRISTLYGFKQKKGKQQGLLAEMVRKAVTNEVIHIYVPLETMRDYISAKVAAQDIIQSARHLEKTPGIYIKIIASEISTSIAQILAILKRICKRNLRVVTQADIKSAQYQRIVQFKSKINVLDKPSNKPNLSEEIADLLQIIKRDIAKG